MVLDSVVVKLKNTPIQLVLNPYYHAKDKIQMRMERKGAGLKMPVALSIKEMPPMLNFDFSL